MVTDMNIYEVVVRADATVTVKVEADSYEEAKRLAEFGTGTGWDTIQIDPNTIRLVRYVSVSGTGGPDGFENWTLEHGTIGRL